MAGGGPVAPPLAAAPQPQVSLAPAAGYTWVVAANEGSRAKGSLLPMGQVVSGHQTGSKGIAAMTDGSILFVELIPSHEVGKYGVAAPAAMQAQPAFEAGGGGTLAANQGDDARTLPVRYGSDGKRRRELRDGVDQASESGWPDMAYQRPADRAMGGTVYGHKWRRTFVDAPGVENELQVAGYRWRSLGT